MDDELETMLRGHYRRAAEGVHADETLVQHYRRLAPDRPANPEPRQWAVTSRRWGVPALAALGTAAVIIVTVISLVRPSAGPVIPHPAGHPASPAAPFPHPTTIGPITMVPTPPKPSPFSSTTPSATGKAHRSVPVSPPSRSSPRASGTGLSSTPTPSAH